MTSYPTFWEGGHYETKNRKAEKKDNKTIA